MSVERVIVERITRAVFESQHDDREQALQFDDEETPDLRLRASVFTVMQNLHAASCSVNLTNSELPEHRQHTRIRMY
jgi:hypothetical protein